jgi:hypothetical protein
LSAVLLFHLSQATEVAQGGGAGIARGKAPGAMFGFERFQVMRELGIEFAVESPSSKKIPESGEHQTFSVSLL